MDNGSGCEERRVALPAGKNLSITFKSKIDGSLQPFAIKIPSQYDPKKKWPLLVTLHGMDDGPVLAHDIDSMVLIGPNGRGSTLFTGIGMQDVFECIEITKGMVSIDEDRVYLGGFSMGAVATFYMGLHFPDLWAACVPVCGKWNDPDALENARNLPFWINAGGKDTVLPACRSEEVYRQAKELGLSEWKYTEYPEMDHSFSIDWKSVEKWLLKHKRVKNPKRVSFTTSNLQTNGAYWAYIMGMEHYGQPTRIDASIDGQTVRVTLKNVSRYRLKLNDQLIDPAKNVVVYEDGNKVFDGRLGKDLCFDRNLVKKGLSKRPGLCGPMWDIYAAPCVLVYPSSKKIPELTQAAKNCAECFLNPNWMEKVTFKLLSDAEVTPKDIAQNNLVLFGNPEVNTLLARISEQLPVKMKGNKVLAHGKEFSGKNIGFILIYPNPLNPKKYVAVFCGNNANTIDSFEKIWPQFNSRLRKIDGGVFEIDSENDSVIWHMTEVFNSDWNLQTLE